MTDDIPPPRADRTQLQQIIAGLNDGVILVDPDQAIAWANATALALHGVTRVEELGATVSEFRERFELTYRNRHKLPEGDYPMERLLAGEAFSEVVVEVRQKSSDRHWVHSIRTLVLTDKHRQPDCLVLIINDETERFNAEERFERTFSANPAPAIIARLADMRYVKVNRGFLELTGLERDDLIGRSVHDFDVLNGAQKRELAIKQLHAGETIPQMEGCLALPGGRERTVLLGGQPIAIGDQRCMLFTFADLHPRQQAQTALKHSEERFSKAFHMAPGPMAILALDGFCVADVNDAFTMVTGWSARGGARPRAVRTGLVGRRCRQCRHRAAASGMRPPASCRCPARRQGGQHRRLPAFRGDDGDPRHSLRPQPDARRQRAQADGNRATCRRGVSDAGHHLAQPAHRRAPGEREGERQGIGPRAGEYRRCRSVCAACSR